MNSIAFPCILAALIALSACSTVTNKTVGALTVDGKTYSTLTRDLQSGQGSKAQTYTTTTVSVRALHVTCDLSKVGNCEDTVRRAERGDARRSVDSSFNGNIYTLPFGL